MELNLNGGFLSCMLPDLLILDLRMLEGKQVNQSVEARGPRGDDRFAGKFPAS